MQIDFLMPSSTHKNLNSSPISLAFGNNTFINVRFETDWELIRKKRELIKKNNKL